MMIVLTVSDEHGNELPEQIKITAESIMKDGFLKEILWERWNENHNKCICTLNESQAYCECDGVYGSNTQITKVEESS